MSLSPVETPRVDPRLWEVDTALGWEQQHPPKNLDLPGNVIDHRFYLIPHPEQVSSYERITMRFGLLPRSIRVLRELGIIEGGERTVDLVLHSGEYGDFEDGWRLAIDEFLMEQYKDVNGYISGPGIERSRDGDLVTWVTDPNGNILAVLGLERHLDNRQLTESAVEKEESIEDIKKKDPFSSQKFFPGQFASARNLVKLGIPVDIRRDKVGELTRFTVDKGKDPPLPSYIRYSLQALLAFGMARAISQWNRLNIDIPIEVLLGNITVQGPARSRLKDFLNGRVSFVDYEVSIRNGNPLIINPYCLKENDPNGLGYASPYMQKHIPGIGKNGEPVGLCIFSVYLTQEDYQDIIKETARIMELMSSEGSFILYALKRRLVASAGEALKNIAAIF